MILTEIIHPSSLIFHPFKKGVAADVRETSAANLAEGSTVGKAEWIGKRRIGYGQGKVC